MMAVLVLPLMAWLGVRAYEYRYAPLPKYSAIDEKLKEDVFSDQYDSTLSLNDYKGRITVNNFFFTRCPLVCPKMTKQLLRVQQAFAGDERVQLLSFSVDPDHDTGAVLRNYAGRYAVQYDNWRLITGSKPLLYRLARNAFRLTATDGDGGPSDFIHSDQLVLVDGAGTIRGYYQGVDSKAVDLLIHDIKQLEHEP